MEKAFQDFQCLEKSFPCFFYVLCNNWYWVSWGILFYSCGAFSWLMKICLNSLQKFCNFLVKCESITQLSQWKPVDTPDTICVILSKLPGNLRDNWVWLVVKVRRKEQREATLYDFFDFTDEETMLVNKHPLMEFGLVAQIQQRCAKYMLCCITAAKVFWLGMNWLKIVG